MNASDFTLLDNHATRDQIFSHLSACNRDYLPPLSERVDLFEYAAKIRANADTYEAWNGDRLAAMIAAYVDPAKRSAFITSVSVESDFRGLGLASMLLERCLNGIRSAGTVDVALEVHENAAAAIGLYRKHGFVQTRSERGTIRMTLPLAEPAT